MDNAGRGWLLQPPARATKHEQIKRKYCLYHVNVEINHLQKFSQTRASCFFHIVSIYHLCEEISCHSSWLNIFIPFLLLMDELE